MPYKDDFGDVGAHTFREQVLALFESPALYSLVSVLAPVERRHGGRGRKSGYPPLLQYAVAVTARIYGSQRRAIRELGSDDLWRQACQRYAERTQAWHLPVRPPTDDQQDRFVDWLTSDQGPLGRLSALFTVAAVAQAEELGNFGPSGWPDYTKPDYRHAIFGDGTYIRPFSDVLRHKNPDGTYSLTGSRATDCSRARVQDRLTDPKPDQKTARGINHVTLGTWTDAGWVVLANGQAFGGEIHAARELIGVVADILGERLHTVIWDRVIKGQDLQSAMANRRLNVVAKPVARAEESRSSDGVTAPSLTREQAIALADHGAPLPLGTSVYPRSAPHAPDVTSSYFYRYQVLGEGECRHELWVDDGAMFAVEEDERGWLVKTGHARIVSAVPVSGRTNAIEYTFHLDCEHAPGGRHELAARYRHRSKPPRSGPDLALYHVRPIPRADRVFADIHGFRNITESYNSWLKDRLGRNGRAKRLNTDQQFLDQICAGTLANALTWHRHLLRQTILPYAA